MDPTDWLSVRLHDDAPDRACTAVVAGELDVANSGVLRSSLRSALDGRARLDVDLSAVTFMDSCALRDLVTFQIEAVAEGKQVRVVTPSAPVERLLRLSDLFDRLTAPAGCPA